MRSLVPKKVLSRVSSFAWVRGVTLEASNPGWAGGEVEGTGGGGNTGRIWDGRSDGRS